MIYLVKNSFILFRYHCPIERVYNICNSISKNQHTFGTLLTLKSFSWLTVIVFKC